MAENTAHHTYVSLFSGGGVGCHAFTTEGFECILTSEIIKQRLDIQRYNNKCKRDSGYIFGDITQDEIKKKIFDEISLWEKNDALDDVDILVATPPCQGMSVANHHKKDELKRNSLVVESIDITKKINPKIFVFENVRAFLKTGCTDVDGQVKPIHDAILSNLTNYNIYSKIFNFKDYGNPSLRTRTLVIGIRKDIKDASPLEIFPKKSKEKTLKQTIGKLKPLRMMGEISANDIYHSFRPYPEMMEKWVAPLKEGESAFDNKKEEERPHKLENGKRKPNTNKNGDKYRRCYWDKPLPCVHTRNDQIASQMTIHPASNRVFSIRELMNCMTIPDNFKWSETSVRHLNKMSLEEKKSFLKKHELNIRRCIGEAVPPIIFRKIARNAMTVFQKEMLSEKQISKLVASHKLTDYKLLKVFLKKNLNKYSFETLAKIIEMSNMNRSEEAAYYTTKDVCFSLVNTLPDFGQEDVVTILEPSVGVGNFIPLLVEKYRDCKKVNLDLIDINPNSLEILKILLKKFQIPKNFKIKYIDADFLLNKNRNYDVIIGNPPFKKIRKNNELLSKYKIGKLNTETNNMFSFFIEEAVKKGSYVSLIVPKTLLSAPEFNKTRELMNHYNITKIVDFGEGAFNVLIETIGFVLKKTTRKRDNLVVIESAVTGETRVKKQSYITSTDFPCWLIYRNSMFDSVSSKMQLGIFNSFRDRVITKKITSSNGKYRVLKSRNIQNNSIKDIPGYDSYIDKIDDLAVRKFLNAEKAVLIPNLTYYPRACFMPNNSICDGSVAIAQPKNGEKITKDTLGFYSTEEFTEFYKIARNKSTRTMNIDSNSIFFFGKLLKNSIESAKDEINSTIQS